MWGDVSYIKKLLFISLVVLLSSCSGGSYKITAGDIEATKDKISGDYRSFSGYYFKKVNVEVDETLELVFSVETLEGELLAKVIDSEGKTIKTLQNGDSFSLSEPGDFKVQVEGNEHKGNFIISYEIK